MCSLRLHQLVFSSYRTIRGIDGTYVCGHVDRLSPNDIDVVDGIFYPYDGNLDPCSGNSRSPSSRASHPTRESILINHS